MLVLTFEARLWAEAYVRETELPWPLLIDPSRAVYRSYGMRQGSFSAIWSPASWRAYAGLIRKGRRVRARWTGTGGQNAGAQRDTKHPLGDRSHRVHEVAKTLGITFPADLVEEAAAGSPPASAAAEGL